MTLITLARGGAIGRRGPGGFDRDGRADRRSADACGRHHRRAVPHRDGLVYLWAFVAAGFGIHYANSTTTASGATTYGWHFTVDTSQGWITSGFKVSPTAGFVSSTHGPLAPLVQHLPTGVDDFGWMFALAGLGVALTLGIAMRIAGWGALALNVIIWFSLFPPSTNPVIDAEHMAFGLGILLLMFVHAGNRWGLGKWWSRLTPRWLN